MAKKVFISYSHQQADWVREILYPVLSAGGADIVIDYKEFAAGIAVRKQMGEAQARAEVHLLVFTPDYLASDYCRAEMQHAFAVDPGFENGAVLPIVLEACALPLEITAATPLYVDLSGDRQRDGDRWRLVMQRCEADLGTSVPDWVAAFRRTMNALQQRKSVNLLIRGLPRWREFLAQVRLALPAIGVVDLESGRTVSRRGLVAEILLVLANYRGSISADDDLAELERVLESQAPSVLALKHFEKAAERNYGNDLYSSLRYLITEKRLLTLLVQSRAPFASLLPSGHLLSYLEMETVELGAKS